MVDKWKSASVERLAAHMPDRARRTVLSCFDAMSALSEIRDPRVLRAIGPSGLRGLVLQRGRQGPVTHMQASHAAHFDWTYPHDQAEMRRLYSRAKDLQWNAERDLDWNIDVDPMSPEVKLVPDDFLDWDGLEAMGIRCDDKERRRLLMKTTQWLLSQFLHGEQGALFAAAQVTEAVPFFDGKLYGATQVMDEGRHVEVFQRYLQDKLGYIYVINDNLFVLIDSLMTDARWDMKFLGMQIMVEGLALGAFGMLHKATREPLLRALLRGVIRDEARHVHYGVLALRKHFTEELSDQERREREDWSFEIALLMRNRFLAYELYEEEFAHRITRAQWRQFIEASKGMNAFRQTCFSKLVPNLREIGLLSPRILPRYAQAGLGVYFGGKAATQITDEEINHELDAA